MAKSKVTVGVSPVMSDRLQPNMQAVVKTVERALSDVQATLGVPGAAQVQFVPRAVGDLAPWLSFHVNDRPCRYPHGLIHRLGAWLSGVPVDAEVEPSDVMDWVARWNDGQRAADVLSLVAVAAVMRQPSLLLGAAQVTTYGAGLP